jgi:hypothetical protein
VRGDARSHPHCDVSFDVRAVVTPYYQDDLVTIYHGDVRDVLPGQIRADVLVTDPPYSSYDDTPENFLAVVVPIIADALAITKRGAVFCAGTRLWDLPRATAVGGVYLPAAAGRSAWGFSSLAVCLFYGSAPDLQLGAKATAIRSNPGAAGEGFGHPAAKPTAWMRWLVGLASKPTEVVLDPFVGSGTTLVAAKDLGRRAIGIEIEERYCEIAARRCSQEVLGLSA